MTTLAESYRRSLPEPFCKERFSLFKRGVFDDAAIDVYVNEAGDFAVLWPKPSVDYVRYQPRHQKLGLTAYKKTRGVIDSRFRKLAPDFADARSVLEIGAAEGAFLARIAEHDPAVSLASVEPDESTRADRDALAGLRQFAALEEVVASGMKVDIVCLFHVFEHLADPATFLSNVKRVLQPSGRAIIEVPSLDDPLLQLFQTPAYREFYFQKQHPFVYSASSLRRVLERQGFDVTIRPYQRYGMENHLQWLTAAKPGGNPVFRDTFQSCDAAYLSALEASGRTDTVFAIAQVRS